MRPLADEFENAADYLYDRFPRAVNLLRSRARALRKRGEPHVGRHKNVTGFVGRKRTKANAVSIAREKIDGA